MASRVLIVEDDTDIRNLVAGVLRKAGYEPVTAAGGEEALKLLYERRPDLVVLDVGLPQMDGWSVLGRIREVSSVPVLMLSARSTEADKIRGLHTGADDYLTKPFGNGELEARVRALLRRSGGEAHAGQTVQDDGVLRVDLQQRIASVHGVELSLTPLEFRLLATFAAHPGQVLSHERILDLVWDDRTGAYRDQIKLYVGYLRRKLAVAGIPDCVATVRGFGYRYTTPSRAASQPPA